MTKVEIVILLAGVVIVVSLLVVLMRWMRTASLGLRDQHQLGELHKAALLASSDAGIGLPVPAVVAAVPTDLEPDRMIDFSLNTSASMYALLVAGEFFAPQLLVSPVEVLPWVQAKADYDYSAWQPGAASPTFWDPTFVMRIDDPGIGANASYAHLALCGDRLDHSLWFHAADMPVFANRGPRDGTSTGPEHDRSPTLRFHGPRDRWLGYAVRADHSVELLDTFTPAFEPFEDAEGRAHAADNIFRAEFDHLAGPQAAADAWLGVFINATETTAEAVWDPLE